MSTYPPMHARPAMKPHRGVTVLVLGILSLVLCQLLGIFAWLLANRDLKEMNAGVMDPSGRSLTQAGQICGIIGTILFGIGLVFTIFWFSLVMSLLFGAAAAGAGAGGPGPGGPPPGGFGP